MCEWLCGGGGGGGGGEWSDARLVCAGGRSLPAHRSVLASVSPFLKNLLLSCPTEDFPVFIVLPDFDFEAMSSVLYYVYNGEVTVDKHKFEMFLDIVKAMQIYIDYQHIPQSYNENNSDKPSNLLNRENVFTRKSENINDEKYIKIKKGQKIEDLLTLPLNFRDTRDSQLSGKDSEGNAVSFSNVQFEGRQRNSFLRDLFIETYPQNGKVNGLTPSVLAITNERYRGPTSVLLTNANDKHLSALHPPSNISNHTTGLTTCLSMEMQRYEVHCPQNYDQINERSMNHPLQMSHDLGSHLESITDYKLKKMGLDYEINYQMTCKSIDKKILPNKKDCPVPKGCNKINSIKVPIMNQVLGSPWCPRQPNNFKPSHKKCDDITRKSIEGTGVKQHDMNISNDGNNNVRVSTTLMENSDVQVITSIGELANNKEKDHFSGGHHCTICNQVFSSSELLTSHTKRHSTGGRYNCEECGKTFSQLRNYKYHMSVHRGTREFAATCSVCGKYFNDRGYLSSHMKIHRNRKEYKCSMCPKSFNQRVAYNMHVRIHTGIKPHVCEQCGKAFSRKMLLKQHQRTHSGERPYACPHCDKRFADRSNMTLHLRLHTGVKPFTCMLCPKSFTKKHHLKSHVNFHTGAKPYSCPRCQLGFTQSSNMRTHLKKCSAPQPSDP